MKKRERRVKQTNWDEQPIEWLPIDSRIIPLFTFPHVHGIARIFLIIEMTLTTLIVIGTVVLVILRSIT